MKYNARLYNYPGSSNLSVYSKYFEKKDDEEGLHPQDSNDFNSNFRKSYKDTERNEKAERHCMDVSLKHTKNTVFNIARSNIWDYFITLTFDQKKYPSDSYDFCIKKLSDFLRVLRRSFPEVGYLIIPELHKDGKHYHFHGLIVCSDGEALGLAPSVHELDGQIVYNWTRWKYGFSTVTEVRKQNRVTKYITKYITKSNGAILPEKKRYYCSRNLFRVEPEYGALHDMDCFLTENAEKITHMSGKTVFAGNFSVNYFELDNDFPGSD